MKKIEEFLKSGSNLIEQILQRLTNIENQLAKISENQERGLIVVDKLMNMTEEK